MSADSAELRRKDAGHIATAGAASKYEIGGKTVTDSVPPAAPRQNDYVNPTLRAGYVLAMAVLQSSAWANADDELRAAVETFVAVPLSRTDMGQ